MSLNNFLRIVPFYSNLKDKLQNKFNIMYEQNKILTKEVIKLKKQVKISNNQPIKILFLCHRASLWNVYKSLYYELLNNSDFEVKIIVIPELDANNKWSYGENISFFSTYDGLLSYDEGKNEFIDIQALSPDYVFYQQPYNIMMPRKYRSNIVSTYSKICYISYFTFMDNMTDYSVADECYPVDFLKDVSIVFSQNSSEMRYLSKRVSQFNIDSISIQLCGYPKYDPILDIIKRVNYFDKSKSKDKNFFRVLWTPRWTTNENNCHFFRYKDLFINYCKGNSKVQFLFRPHPQSWVEWEKTNEFSKKERSHFFKEISYLDNFEIDDRPEYIDTFFNTDCLISDTSSLIPEYLFTGKPIIYCDALNSKLKFKKNVGFSKGLYWATSWEEVEELLNQLMKENDPLKEIRKSIVDTFFIKDNHASRNIMNYLLDDFLNR